MRVPVAGVVAVALLTAGCSGSEPPDDSESGTSSSSTPSSSSAASGPAECPAVNVPDVAGWTQESGFDKPLKGFPMSSYTRYRANGAIQFWVALTSTDAPQGDGPRGTHREVRIQGTRADLFYTAPTQVLGRLTSVLWPVPGQAEGCDLLIGWGGVSPRRALTILNKVSVG